MKMLLGCCRQFYQQMFLRDRSSIHFCLAAHHDPASPGRGRSSALSKEFGGHHFRLARALCCAGVSDVGSTTARNLKKSAPTVPSVRPDRITITRTAGMSRIHDLHSNETGSSE